MHPRFALQPSLQLDQSQFVLVINLHRVHPWIGQNSGSLAVCKVFKLYFQHAKIYAGNVNLIPLQHKKKKIKTDVCACII